jgi:hypothetical protein
MAALIRERCVGAEETCRLAAELVEEFGEAVSDVAERAIVTLEADGFADRALMWRAIHAILGDIAAKRFDPYAPIAIH